MPTLLECLQFTSFRHLWAIAQAHFLLPPQRHPPKQVWIETLHAFLADPAVLQRIVSQLSDAEQDALHALLALPHPALQHAFCARHGPIRPYRPWDRSAPQPDQPWRFPVSSAEHLWYLGLLFPAPPDRPGGQPRLTLAAEQRAFLADYFQKTSSARAAPLSASAYAPPLFDATFDLTILLALLHRHDIALAHQRWLPASFWQIVNPQTRQPAALPGLRSELQAPRLHFLHYLAQTLGLLASVGDWRKPAPTAALWLQADAAVRVQQLWNAWLQPDLWAAFHLPAANTPDPTAFVQHLLQLLNLAPADEWRTIPVLLKELKRFIHSQPVWWQTPAAAAELPHILADLCLGPLAWVGLVSLKTDTRLHVRLCPAARAWLNGGALPPLPAPQPFTLSLDPARLAFQLPAGEPARVDLARLFAIVSQFGGLQCDPDELALILANDVSLDAVLNLLSGASGRPLNASEYAILAAWTAPAAITIHRLTVLETADPAHLSALTTRRSLRPLLGRTLNRRLVVVPDRHLPQLIGRLRRLRIPHRLTIPAAAPAHSGKSKLTDSGFLYLAGLVFQQLGRFSELPLRLPAAALERLAADLSPETTSDLHALAEEFLARLQSAFDGYSGPPLDNPHPTAPAETQAQLAAAIAAERSVDLTYWTAWRGELTHRRVDPYRLETRGTTTYLVAYCHLRRAERVFRLDRILAVADSEPSASASAPPSDDDLTVPF